MQGSGVEEFAAEFQRATGFPLPPRRANRLEDRETRRDTLLPVLSGWAFDHPEAVPALRAWARAWRDRLEIPATWELYGYLSYLEEDWREAATAFMRSIELEPGNLDAWVDLAFALKHMGLALGESILFDHDEFLRTWEAERPPRCDLFALRALERRIREEGRAYRDTYRRWTDAYGVTGE